MLSNFKEVKYYNWDYDCYEDMIINLNHIISVQEVGCRETQAFIHLLNGDKRGYLLKASYNDIKNFLQNVN